MTINMTVVTDAQNTVFLYQGKCRSDLRCSVIVPITYPSMASVGFFSVTKLRPIATMLEANHAQNARQKLAAIKDA